MVMNIGAITSSCLLGLTVVIIVIAKKLSSTLSAVSSTSRDAESAELPLPPGLRGWTALRSLLRTLRWGSFHVDTGNWGPPGMPVTCCSAPGITVVSVNRSDLVREALAGALSETALSDRPSTFIGRFLFYGPKDIAMACVTPAWQAQRKLFHTSLRLYGDGVHRFESTVQGELGLLMEKLEGRLGEDLVMEDYMSNTLLNILTVLMTGERPGPDAEVPQAMRSLDRRVSAMGTPAVDFLLRLCPWVRHVPGWYRTQCRLALADRDRLVDSLLSQARVGVRRACLTAECDVQATLCDDQPRGIVDVLLLEQKSSGVSDDHIRGLLLDIVVGGYVTTLASFLSIVLVLLNLPRVAKAIQQELDTHVGQRPPTLEDRKNLHYTEATLLEMMRFMRFFPIGLPHVCTRDTQIAGFRIPKGAVVIANQWLCSRDPNTWQEADKFEPQRFLDDKGQLLPANHPTRRNLLPFGVGKRACPGETFAKTRLFLLVTTLLQRYSFLPPTSGHVIPMDDVPWVAGAVLLPPAFQCRVVRRL